MTVGCEVERGSRTRRELAGAASASAVSLFSNCGAGDVGFDLAGFGFKVLAEIDLERLKIAARNHSDAGVVYGDLRTTWPDVIAQFRATRSGSPDLLAACPPCQGMSTARRDRGRDDDAEAGGRDRRNLLVVPIAEVARELKPRSIVVENVPAFLTRKVPDPKTGLGVSAAGLLVASLKDDYTVFPFLSDLADYGVPQHRKRAFLTFIRREETCTEMLSERGLTPYPIPTHSADVGGTPVTLAEGLKQLDANELDASSPERSSDQEVSPLHSVPVWSTQIYDMIAAIPGGSGRSAWENSECPGCGAVESDQDRPTCSSCGTVLHRPVIEDEQGLRLIKGFRSSSYRRMHPEAPATTVTTANGRVGSSSTIHPWENRVLSPYEAAHLQTIPSDFQWGHHPSVTPGLHLIRTMIGEAVPPLFTKQHGEVLLRCLDKVDHSELLPVDDGRCRKARVKLGVPSEGTAA